MSPTVPPPPLTAPPIGPDGKISDLWSRYFLRSQAAISTGNAPADARYFVGHSHGDLTAETNLGALSSGHLKLTVALGIATPSTSATIPTTDLSGTIQTAQFPATLPALNGSALTALTPTNVTYPVTVVTFAMTPYTVTATNWTLLVDCTGGNVVVTLPAATAGRTLMVKKTDVTASTVQLTGTVDTVVNPTLGTQFQSRVIQADGAAWHIVAGFL